MRSVLVRSAGATADSDAADRVAQLLARGLERLLAEGERNAERVELPGFPDLDLLGDQSVTTQDRRRQSVEGQR